MENNGYLRSVKQTYITFSLTIKTIIVMFSVSVKIPRKRFELSTLPWNSGCMSLFFGTNKECTMKVKLYYLELSQNCINPHDINTGFIIALRRV